MTIFGDYYKSLCVSLLFPSTFYVQSSSQMNVYLFSRLPFKNKDIFRAKTVENKMLNLTNLSNFSNIKKYKRHSFYTNDRGNMS